MIGETISQYRIIEWLGEGAMGVVYLGEHISLGRRAAIKFLSRTTEDYRARFLQEARAASALNHPNIATVFDYGQTTEGQPYIVMELVEGQTLSDKLSEGSLPLPEAVRIVSSIAEALGEAHRLRIVHRDVKPSNVVISERGVPKVLDFGLAKQFADQGAFGSPAGHNFGANTRSDVIVGTPLYLSPEQATGKTVDGRSDLFALGLVLYECITGQAAFAGGSVIEIGAQVLKVTPTLPSELNDHVPPELDRITMKAIEKNVEARYQTADELIKDLQLVVPTLEDNGYRRGRSTESIKKTQTATASALTTLIEQVKRPGPNLGTFILAIAGVALVSWMVFWWWKPAPYKPLPQAKDWYDKGIDALGSGAYLQASKAFDQSIGIDPKFPLAHARLAEAWFELDYTDKAKDEMLKVQALVPDRSQLARSDALHLEAINATVSRDFAGAIKACQELVRLSPNDAQSYVDLGRAFEKNEEPKKALESYEKAKQLKLQHATAFLRAGNLYARQLDQAHAIADFDRAETVFQALGNFEGQAEVWFQRGFLFDQMTKLDDARQHLGRALDFAKSTNNDYLHVKTLQKLGDVEMDANNPAKGRQFMLEAISLARDKGIDNLVKRGLVDLGNTFLVEMNFVEAEKFVGQSLELSLEQKDARNAARARLVLASIAERQAHSDEVIQYVEQALPFYQQGGYRKELLLALALYGRAKVQKGANDEAAQAFEQELKLSLEFDDLAQAGLAQQDLGFIAMRQGKYPEALRRADEYHKIGQSISLPKAISSSSIDRANALWRMGRYEEAHAALSEALAIVKPVTSTKNPSVAYHLVSSLLALSERKFPEAQKESQETLLLAGTQLKRSAITATLTEALALSLSGKSPVRLKYTQAIDLARQIGDPTTLSEALLAMAQLQLHTDDSEGALKTALEAQQMFARAGNKDGEWVAWLLAAAASKGASNSAKRAEFASNAEKALAAMEAQWNNNNYNSYLNRPDINILHTQLTQLLAEKQ